MPQRALPGLDRPVSALGLGCWAFGARCWGPEVNDTDSAAAIERVLELGVTLLDTAPLYGDGQNVRDWLHVEDHNEAVLTVLEKGTAGEQYCIGGNNERSNLELTHSILELMGKGKDMIEPVTDRLGHDRRYAIDATKLKTELGWQPTRSAWPQALEATVKWYVDNPQWWQRVKSGEYRKYYEKQYGGR